MNRRIPIVVLFVVFMMSLAHFPAKAEEHCSAQIGAHVSGATGQILYVGIHSDQTEYIGVVNPDGTGEQNLADGSNPEWSSDGKSIFYNGDLQGNFEVFSLDPRTGMTEVITHNGNNVSPFPSPDGKHVAYFHFMSNSQTELWVTESADGKTWGNERLLLSGQNFWGPSDWMKNGEAIATSVQDFDGQHYTYRIVLVDLNGNVSDLYRGDQLATHLTWSPDGKHLAYVLNGTLMVTDARGSAPIVLASDLYETIAWSPDSHSIIFSQTSNDPMGRLAVVDLMGNITFLTDGKALDSFPTWMPDGQHIVYSSAHVTAPELFIMNADGTNQRRLTTCEMDS